MDGRDCGDWSVVVIVRRPDARDPEHRRVIQAACLNGLMIDGRSMVCLELERVSGIYNDLTTEHHVSDQVQSRS